MAFKDKGYFLSLLHNYEPNDNLLGISMYFTQGGPQYQAWPLETDELSEHNGVVLNIPAGGRGVEDAKQRIDDIIRSGKLHPYLMLHENRYYLKKNFLPAHINKHLQKDLWLMEEHLMAASNFVTTHPINKKVDDFTGNDSWELRVLFHREFITTEDKLERCTLQVVGKAKKKGLTGGIGSAFCINIEGRLDVYTAKHVVGEKGDAVQLVNFAGESIHAEVDFVYPDYDAARLKILSKPSNVAVLKRGRPDLSLLNDPVFVCGYPHRLGNKPTISSGHISKINAEYEGETGLIQISAAAVNPNNSGGPVTDSSGNVIGILTTKALKSNTQNIAFAEPMDRILRECK